MISINKTVVILPGPASAKICPINHGRNMPPIPDPTRNQPVMAPLIVILSDASIILVGNMDAIDSPNATVPIHKAGTESFHIMMIRMPTPQPIRSINRMVCDRARAEIQMAASLPRVKDPQNAEVRYAAVMVVPSPSVRAYV